MTISLLENKELRQQQRYQKASESIHQLSSSDRSVVLGSLRFLKNSMIGNPTRKKHYLKTLTIAPQLVGCLTRYKTDTVLMTEIAPIIGSLAQYDVISLVEAGVLIPLFESLSAVDYKVVEASARALRQIVQHPLPISFDSISSSHVYHLVSLSKPPALEASKSLVHISEVAVSILARLAEHPKERENISEAGAITILVQWLNDEWIHFPRVQEAALDALASMCKSSGTIASTIAGFKIQSSGENVVARLFKMLQDKRSSMRLGASSCLVHLYNNLALPSRFDTLVTQQLLPAIIRLFDDSTSISSQMGISITTVQERALALFADLVCNHAKLQSASLDGDAITKIARVLLDLEPKENQQSDSSSQVVSEVLVNPEKLQESALLAIASVSSLTEECRRQVIDLRLVQSILNALPHTSVAVRIAACKCARSLSRSVKNLRTSLMDAGFAQPLFNLLFDNDLEVQITASATICNIVLDFSPMKRIVIERGGSQQLVKLIHSTHLDLRLNAVWALKNMIFQADLETKKGVMAHLGWPTLVALTNDQEVAIQIQALNLLRNLACAKIQDIEYVFEGLGTVVIMNLVEEKLSNFSNHHQILLHTIYILVNIAIGTLAHKTAIMSRPKILESLLSCMRHENEQIRIGAIWSVINLTWPDEAGVKQRIEIFKHLNFQSVLFACSDIDKSADVRDRAKTALTNMKDEDDHLLDTDVEMRTSGDC